MTEIILEKQGTVDKHKAKPPEISRGLFFAKVFVIF